MNSASHTDRAVSRQYEEAKNAAGSASFGQNMQNCLAGALPMRDASPTEQALNALNDQIEHAIEVARELRTRLNAVSSPSAGETGEACKPKAVAMSLLENRIDNASDGIQQLTDVLRSAIHGLRI